MSISPDARFRMVNDYSGLVGFAAGFPNFHEADYGQGKVGGVHLLQSQIVDWADVPRSLYSIFEIEDVPGLFRAAHRIAGQRFSSDGRRYASAFPNCHQAIVGGEVVYGTNFLKSAFVEVRTVTLAELGNPRLTDVPAMMQGANLYGTREGFNACYPTFDDLSQRRTNVVLIPSAYSEWRDIPLDDLIWLEGKAERTLVVLGRMRADDGVLLPVPHQQAYYEDFFFRPGARGLHDYFRETTHGRLRLEGLTTDWLDLGRTLSEHRAMQAQAQCRRSTGALLLHRLPASTPMITPVMLLS